MNDEILTLEERCGVTWKSDVQISRRKRCHALSKEDGNVVFWAYTLGEVFEYLAANEIQRIEVETDKGFYSLQIQLTKTKEEK